MSAQRAPGRGLKEMLLGEDPLQPEALWEKLYVGSAKGPGKQLKYADQYEIPIVLLYGTNEKEQGIVTIKDMTVGREKAKAVGDRKEWLAARPGQTTAKRADLVSAVQALLAEIERTS